MQISCKTGFGACQEKSHQIVIDVEQLALLSYLGWFPSEKPKTNLIAGSLFGNSVVKASVKKKLGAFHCSSVG